MDLKAVFEEFSDEFLEFARIEKPMHARPDICAFLMLDKLVPGTHDIVCCAEHDEFWLDVTPDQLAAVATPDDIRDLIRCGLRYDTHADSLGMFV